MWGNHVFLEKTEDWGGTIVFTGDGADGKEKGNIVAFTLSISLCSVTCSAIQNGVTSF